MDRRLPWLTSARGHGQTRLMRTASAASFVLVFLLVLPACRQERKVRTTGADGGSAASVETQPSAEKSKSEPPAPEKRKQTSRSRLSAHGESCAGTGDCEAGLRCKRQTCLKRSESPPSSPAAGPAEVTLSRPKFTKFKKVKASAKKVEKMLSEGWTLINCSGTLYGSVSRARAGGGAGGSEKCYFAK